MLVIRIAIVYVGVDDVGQFYDMKHTHATKKECNDTMIY